LKKNFSFHSTPQPNDRGYPVVAHLRKCLFMPSETFIYHVITHLRQVQPICLAAQYINIDEFTFNKNRLFTVAQARRSFLWSSLRTRARKPEFSLPRAITLIKKKDVKLLHAHFGYTGVFAADIKNATGLPLVTAFYGSDITALPTLKEWGDRYVTLFGTGDIFLVEGPFMKTALEKLGCPPDKIKIQKVAIPVKKIPHRPRYLRTDGKVILVFCGRLVEKKGVLQALQALQGIRGKTKNFEFRIIGDGPLKQDLEDFVARHNLKDCIRFLGFLPYSSHLEEMQKADIYLHPSVTAVNGDSEGGAPTSILEAQALGLPIISSYHADIPAVVAVNESALLSPEGNTQELGQNLARLINQPELWHRMGEAGRAFVEKNHDIDKEIAALEQIYFSLI
jgi:colanic acid/amylovoran biosynthesis glycosyltransferase